MLKKFKSLRLKLSTNEDVKIQNFISKSATVEQLVSRKFEQLRKEFQIPGQNTLLFLLSQDIDVVIANSFFLPRQKRQASRQATLLYKKIEQSLKKQDQEDRSQKKK